MATLSAALADARPGVADGSCCVLQLLEFSRIAARKQYAVTGEGDVGGAEGDGLHRRLHLAGLAAAFGEALFAERRSDMVHEHAFV